ncbi:ead/Ea22-like family protein [Salmonella enterica subsp. enterica serovar Techimani]|nr:ead/Ea22-like family protein [Salmonella enterica subsp. enterica serovar Techimani]EJN3654852.1 ead/Ea22-like family protein [Salmonella enterica subsp. enterica serovar Techimani]EJN3668425.1 ead/Ea22-like family protein [Salmonella enterica subsp. enterica serovar Techimani]EJN3672140.1 ead/Ea22-like family protein [Salmonella enterica subsp. enterica serovar Techimani]EKE2607182.1 ead/Ea22-like family protein [Salmonella enterica]
MSNVKIYTATPADLSPPVQSESFCVDLVLASDYRELEAKCMALVAENAHARERHAFIRALAVSILEHSGGRMDWRGAMADATELCQTVDSVYAKSPATDAFLAEVRAKAHKEGAYFVANRMLAAWDAGFIDDTAKNAADIARMILTSTEFMADAPEGDFDRSFADGVLEGIAAQLRKGVQS